MVFEREYKCYIQNNVFMNLPGAAKTFAQFEWRNAFSANNTIVDCEQGIWIQDGDLNAIIIDNIFYGTATAIERTGSNSSTAFYNCFYDNAIDFVGYPAAYGDIVMTNANGDSCDLGFNILRDPLFTDPLFHLSDESHCIGAGKDSIQIDAVWYHAPDHDFDGNPRPIPAETATDMGARESDYMTGISLEPVVLFPRYVVAKPSNRSTR
jgi:hypothetical protein